MVILEWRRRRTRTRTDSRTSCGSSGCSVPFRIGVQRGRDEDHRGWRAGEIGRWSGERLYMKKA